MLIRTIEKRNEKNQERGVQRLRQKKRSRDKHGEVQDLAVLKRMHNPTRKEQLD